MFLNWITQLGKNAVLNGFREAVEKLALQQTDGEDALETFKKRMTALPALPGNGKKDKAK
jgi:hypothetical protein